MSNKYEQYEQLCDEKLEELISSKGNWLGFLDTASRMYKYSFEEQVLIHAQRPDSRAVANFDFWTSASKMNRHIKKGSKSIVLIDRENQRLNYVYAVEDTEERVNGKSQNPENYIWKINPELVDNVNRNLCTQGKINSDSFESTISSLCSSMSKARLDWYDTTFDVLYSKSNTTRTKEEVAENFRKMLTASATVVVMKRCGLDTSNYESTQDFSALERLPANIGILLGKAVGDISRQVLQQYVVPAVKEENEKRRDINEFQRGTVTEEYSRERDTIYTGRNNTDLHSRLDNEEQLPHQEVGQSERAVSQGTSGNNLQYDADEERTERASAQHRRTGSGDNRTDNEVNGEGRRTDRGNEGYGYAEMGGTDEQLQTGSRGDNQERTDRSIKENTAEVEQKTTSAVSFADKMHSAFMQVEMQYNFTTKQSTFMNILENYMVEHQLTDIDLPKEFEKDNSLFKNVYDTITNVSQIFARRLNQVLKSLKSAITDTFSANSEITEMEQNFLNADVERIMAKSVLAWDEIEDLGYIFFEEGYIDRFPASTRARYGNGFVEETEIYVLAEKRRNGEDIRSDLTRALLGNQQIFRTPFDNEFSVIYNKNDITATYGNVKRYISYEAVGDAFFNLFEGEYNDIVKARQEEEREERELDKGTLSPNIVWTPIPESENDEGHISSYSTKINDRFYWISENPNKRYDIETQHGDSISPVSEETTDFLTRDLAEQYFEENLDVIVNTYDITFHNEVNQLNTDEEQQKTTTQEDSIKFSWGSDGETEWFTESAALYEIAEKYPDMSYALANAVIEYLDEKQHIEREIPELDAGWYDKTDFTIEYTFDGETATYDGRYDIGDGKGAGGGTITEHIKQYLDYIVEKNPYHYDDERYNAAVSFRDEFIPLLEKNSKLTSEEKNILKQIKDDYPIRTAEMQRDIQKELTTEKNREIAEKIAVGDYFAVGDKLYIVTDMNSDFMLSYDRVNADGTRYTSTGDAGGSIIGNWKDIFVKTYSDTAVVHMTADEFRLETAKKYISDYIKREFDLVDANFSDLSNVSLAHTSDEENGNYISVSADLENYRMIYEYDGIIVREENYNSLDEMSVNALSVLNFNDLVSISDEEKAFAQQKWNEVKQENISTYKIYQIKEGEQYHYNRFESFESNNGKLNIDDYDLVYTGNLTDIEGSNKLDGIYERMNIGEKPDGYTGHSLSVSDVIVIENNGEQTVHYVDSIGFADFPAFLQEKTQELEQNYVDIPVTTIEMPENNIFIDLKDIDRFTITNTYSQYEGGIDSDGHERKDNYSRVIESISIELTTDNRIIVTEDSGRDYSYPQESEYDTTVSSINELKDKISDFISNAEVFNAHTYKGTEQETVFVTQTWGAYVELYNNTPDIFVLRDTKTKETLVTGTEQEILDYCNNNYGKINVNEYELKKDMQALRTNHFDIPIVYTTDDDKDGFRLSVNENQRCSELISKAIADNYHLSDHGLGGTLDTETAYNSVAHYYPMERIQLIIASTVYMRKNDGRIDNDVREWADNFINALPESFIRNQVPYVTINNHSGLLNMFAQTVIERERQFEQAADKAFEESVIEEFENNSTKNQRTVDDIKAGDRYRYKHDEYTVTDLKGIYPDDVVITKQERSYMRDHWVTFETTSNVDKFDLHNNGEFLGNVNEEKQIEQPEKDLQIGDHIEVEGKRYAVATVNDFYISLRNLDETDIQSGMGMTNWKKKLDYKKIDGFGVPQTESHKPQNEYTMSKMKKKIKALDSTENFYDNVREIIGYNEGIVHSDKNIKTLQALADAQFEYLKELEQTQPSLFNVQEETENQSLFNGVNQLEELRKEIKRGSGFEDGKLRIYNYYTENQPNNKEFADMLKKEYGIGGHSANDPIAFVDHDSKGLQFTLNDENGKMSDRKFTFNWTEIAKETARLIDKAEYFTEKEIEKYNINASEISISETDTGLSLEKYGINIDFKDINALNLVTKNTENPEIEDAFVSYYFMDNRFYKSELGYDDTETNLGTITEEVTEFCKQMNSNQFITCHDKKDNEVEVLSGLSMQIDDFSDIDTEQIKNNLENPTPEMNAFIQQVITDSEKLTEEFEEKYSIYQMKTEGRYRHFQSESIDYCKSQNFYPTASDFNLVSTGNLAEIQGDDILEEIRSKHSLDVSNVIVIERNGEKTAHYTERRGFQNFPDFFSGQENSIELKSVSENTEQSVEKTKVQDFVITDDELSVGGAKTRFRANIDAIKTLKTIESENRDATPEEQVTLSKYVGWGGLKPAFEDFQKDWQKEYAELKEILTPEEYRSASASVLDAFYTSPKIIDAMYTALENNGFKGGRILEPSMAIGNFFGKMPQEMRDNSSLHGVEVDSISGRIAQKLYPSADIKITGFEQTTFRDNSFDLAVGNVPFGDSSLHEKKYDKYHFKIHDHFFAKSLDKVKENGIVAFITSTGTMDKKNTSVRKYLAERAELVGAIRLPSGAFKASAGTDVDSDIIFLQKRPQPIELTADNMPNWVELGQTENGLPINNYFAENPDMVLGKMVEGNKMFGREGTSCVAIEGTNLDDLLANAIKNIRFDTVTRIDENDVIENDREVQIPLGTRNFSFAVVNDKLYYRNNDEMELFEGNKTDEKRIRDAIVLRDTLRELIDAQINDYPDETIKELQTKLNLVYDQYTEKHGRIHEKENQKALDDESSLPLLTSLERYKGENFEGKAAIFSERTIRAKVEITHVDNANEALVVSLAEKGCVDIDLMQQLTGKDADSILSELIGVVYENPLMPDENGNPHLETADEYLSGNIRQKLDAMKEQFAENPRYEHNIDALEKAMPIPLKAGDIDIQLGATWIDPLIVQQFMYETMKTAYTHQEDDYDRKYHRNKSKTIRALYSRDAAVWNITNKRSDSYNQYAMSKFGTARLSPYEILEDCLNLKATVVRDKIIDADGNEKSVVNKEETDLAQEKQGELKEAFSEWIFANPERTEKLVEQYNVLFNSSRPREYDGTHLNFPEMNSEIKLRKHQKDAIAHALYGGNTLFAHEVGAGKTFEMIGAIMEGKRLGLNKKALLCVPNHLTEQVGADFIKLYPNANILVATSKDFEMKNRKKLFAKIATGDYDAVIIGHSQLVRLPVSPEKQRDYIQKEINELAESVNALKAANGERFHIAQLERMIKKLKDKLQKLIDAPKRDDEIYFEELGIDKLVLDEAHIYKNLFVATKLSNISGISTNENTQKTVDLYLKCQYLDEITGSKGLIFATGTPVSNSISEIHSMMKYLQSDLLRERNMTHFDAWAASFAEIVTDSQLSPDGNKYQMKTRFAKFNNMDELMSMWKECADIKTTDQLGLDVPDCKLEIVVAKPTEMQLAMMDALGERSDRIHNGNVDPHTDNMPKICGDGRKNALDIRLLNPDLPDSEGTKVNLCVDNVFKIWDETADKRLTQLIFCDLGVPLTPEEKKKGVNKFTVYDDIKEKLIAKGIPENEIAFIHDAKTEIDKDRLFSKVRSGEVRVLLGSTTKMGTGTNVQDLIIASHDLDAPFKPAELEQRRGRMVRQGNKNKEVTLFRYVTEGTFDAYNYQILENKQAFASQIMSNKSSVRSCADVDDVQMDHATCKALCVRNPLIKERMDLEIAVSKLNVLKGKHTNEQYEIQRKVNSEIPNLINVFSSKLEKFKKDKETVEKIVVPVDEKGNKMFCGIEINGKHYDDKETASDALREICSIAVAKDSSSKVVIGSYKGFDLRASFDYMSKSAVVTLVGESEYKVELGTNNIIRLDNALNSFDKKIDETQKMIEEQKAQLELIKQELGKPFSREEELQEKSKKLTLVIAAIECGLSELPPPSAKIEEPYLIEVKSQDQIEKLKESGIEFDTPETNDGKLIVRIEKKDAGKVKEIVGNGKSQKLSR